MNRRKLSTVDPPDKDPRPLKHFRPPLKTDTSSLDNAFGILHISSNQNEVYSKKKIVVQGRLELPSNLKYPVQNGTRNGETSVIYSAGSGTIASFGQTTRSSQNWRLGNHGPDGVTNNDRVRYPVLKPSLPKVSNSSFDRSQCVHGSIIKQKVGCKSHVSMAGHENVTSNTSSVGDSGQVMSESSLRSPTASPECVALDDSVDFGISLLPVSDIIRRPSTSMDTDRSATSGYCSEDISRSSSSCLDEPARKQARTDSENKVLLNPAEDEKGSCDSPVKCVNNFQSPKQPLDLSDCGLPTSFGKKRTIKRKACVPSSDRDIEDLVNECFSKQFQFQSSHWTLPDAALLFKSKEWELPAFQALKMHLNGVKNMLNDLSLNDWHHHTKQRNCAGSVVWQLRRKADPELPTQAWCKFYEIVSSLPLLSERVKKGKSLNSVHLCEAPGAFVTSLNHYLRSKFGTSFLWQWKATTLNPYYEGNPLSFMINDDRFILHTLDHWTFGKDYTGDLMTKANLQHLLKQASVFNEILLVTADGSIDCQDNPAEQEATVSWLHYCETIAGLNLLSPGGNFLIKMFTVFEHPSICLMYLLNCVFKTVYVTKPVTSKAGNSEMYVVCCDYIGAERCRPWLDALNEVYGSDPSSLAMFALDQLPDDFIEQVFMCSKKLSAFQEQAITENIRTFKKSSGHDRYVQAALRHKVSNEFFKRYQIVMLKPEHYLVNKFLLDTDIAPNMDPRMSDGSFNDRQRRLTMSPIEELACIREDLDRINIGWPCDSEVFWMDFPTKPEGFVIIRGKAVTQVNSSKFCLGRLLHIRNRVRDIAKNHFHVNTAPLELKRNDEWYGWPKKSPSQVVSLDFKNELWASLESGSNANQEKKACLKILSAIEGMWRNQCLQIRGYPMLTQFNVGLIFLLGHLFEKVGFLRPQGQDIVVLFSGFRKWDSTMQSHFKKVENGMKEDGGDAFLSVASILQLSGGDFYKYVTEINNLCVLEQVKDILNKMPSA